MQRLKGGSFRRPALACFRPLGSRPYPRRKFEYIVDATNSSLRAPQAVVWPGNSGNSTAAWQFRTAAEPARQATHVRWLVVLGTFGFLHTHLSSVALGLFSAC